MLVCDVNVDVWEECGCDVSVDVWGECGGMGRVWVCDGECGCVGRVWVCDVRVWMCGESVGV